MTTFLLRRMPPRNVVRGWRSLYPHMDVRAVEVYITFLSAAGRVLDEASTHMARWGTSQARFRLLINLLETPQGLMPSELAERMGVTRATVTALADGMVKRGLVKRVHSSSGDRRCATIHILPEGRRLANAIMPARFKRMEKMMRGLSAKERADLIRLLDKLSKGVRALDGEKP